ncbi:hypothetical protein E308F_11440 [Moorella sp. E308F]|nr:hypothetical protein E308F_11440 [Moorella sp. E308F]
MTQYLIKAADISLQYGLPMADAIFYTVTSMYGSQIVTSDKHSKGLEMVIIWTATHDALNEWDPSNGAFFSLILPQPLVPGSGRGPR